MSKTDRKQWEAAQEAAREINHRITVLKRLCIDAGIALIDTGQGDEIFLRTYGQGNLITDYAGNAVTEVWQDSMGCSEQGSRNLRDQIYEPHRVLNDPTNTLLHTIIGWDESASHWDN